MTQGQRWRIEETVWQLEQVIGRLQKLLGQLIEDTAKAPSGS